MSVAAGALVLKRYLNTIMLWCQLVVNLNEAPFQILAILNKCMQ